VIVHDNLQTRFVAGLRNQFGNTEVVPLKGQVTEAHFNQAIDNINQFFRLVGIAEKFNKFISKVNLEFNCNILFDYEVLNVNPLKKKKYSEMIDCDTLKFLLQYNFYDFKLYNYIKKEY
jgi:hypothetical protein